MKFKQLKQFNFAYESIFKESTRSPVIQDKNSYEQQLSRSIMFIFGGFREL